MFTRYAQVALLTVLCFVFAGCGGGSGSGNNGGGGGGGNNPTTVTFNFTGAAPAAVATQIGTGNFTAATVSSNAVTISVPSGTKNFAAAWACPALVSGQYSSTNEYVIEATTSDATSYVDLWCPSTAPTVPTGTLTLSVDASAFAETTSNYWTFLVADADNASGFEEGGPPMVSSNFTMPAPSGSDRVDLIVDGETLVSGTAYQNLVAVKSYTGVTVPGSLNGGNTVTFTSADAAVSEPITYKNLPAYYNQPISDVLIWQSGDNYFIADDQGETTTYAALPSTIAAPGDSYSLNAVSYALVGSGAPSGILELVTAGSNFQGEGPATVTFPTPWTYAGPTPAALPALDLAYSGFSSQNEVVEAGSLYWYLPSDFHTSYNYWMGASSSYLSGTPTLQFPDLTHISGFIPNPVSGAQLNWQGSVCQGGPGVGQPTPKVETESCVAAAASYTVP